MKIFVRTCIGAAFVASLLSVNAFAECSAADRDALIATDQAWGAAVEKGDKDAMMGIISADFAGFNLTGTQNRAGMLENITPAEDGAPKATSDMYIVSCVGDTATMTHRIELRDEESGRVRMDFRRSIHVFQKKGGKWHVVSNVSHPVNDGAWLMYAEQSRVNAIVNKDTGFFQSMLADNYVSINPMGRPTGKADILESLAQGRVPASIEIVSMDANVTGATGTVNSIEVVKGTNADGQAWENRLNVITVFNRMGGTWRIVNTTRSDVRTRQ
jgi:ketosteroid isomerase-like protein